jgi:hypothetical protein
MFNSLWGLVAFFVNGFDLVFLNVLNLRLVLLVDLEVLLFFNSRDFLLLLTLNLLLQLLLLVMLLVILKAINWLLELENMIMILATCYYYCSAIIKDPLSSTSL